MYGNPSSVWITIRLAPDSIGQREEHMKTMWQTARVQQMIAGNAAAKKAKKERRKRRQAIEIFKRYGKPPKYVPGMGSEFYITREWRTLRWEVLSTSDGSCVMCGATRKSSGQSMHVDHIHPRSTHPHLELSKSNLQILCADCNIGKGKSIWQPEQSDARQEKPKFQRAPARSPS